MKSKIDRIGKEMTREEKQRFLEKLLREKRRQVDSNNIVQQKVVLISGGSRGLGSALVSLYHRQGHIVASFSRSSTEIIREYQNKDREENEFMWREIDISDADNVRQYVRTVADRYGRIDVLINNAAIGSYGLFALMSMNDIKKIIQLNFEGTIHITQECVQYMLGQQSGCIINISSITSISGHEGISVYSATKSALDGLTRSLARELGPKNIRVNSVAPGYFETDMVAPLTQELRNRIIEHTPLGRLGDVDDIVGAVMFLASEDAKYITGQTLIVDGGYTC